MVCVLQTLHLSYLDFRCSNFLTNFQLNIDVKLSMDSFKLAFLHMPHFFVNGLSCMVFKHFGIFGTPSGFIS
jgi:hypothetical protein